MYENHEQVVPLIWEGNQHTSPNNNVRSTLYGVGGIPHCQIGGKLSVVGGGGNMYSSYLGRYNGLIDDESPVEMSMQLNVNETGNLVVDTAIEVTEAITTTNNKVFTFLTNKYSEDYFATVCFYQEDQFSLTAAGETADFSTVLDIDSSLSYENIGVAVIIQTIDGDKSVLGARYYPLLELMDPVVQEEMQFGEIGVGETGTLPITITNYWDTPLTGQFISQGVFQIQDSFEVPAFQSLDFDMNFVPVEATEYYTALIVLMNNDTFQNDIINIYGTGVSSDTGENEVPESSAVLGNYPNPFNPNTTISYNVSVAEANSAELKIYDAKGKVIRTFKNLTSGENSTLDWNGTDSNGNICPSGVYFYQLSNVKSSVQKKMVLMK